MFYFVGVLIVNLALFPRVFSNKAKSVNVALETVLEFDQNNLASDVKIIDNMQKFLSKVRKVLDETKVYRRNFGTDPDTIKFTEFLLNCLQALKRLDDETLAVLMDIFDDEIRKYHYKGCKFHELLQNPEMRKYISKYLNEMRNIPATELRPKLRDLITILEKKKFGSDVLDLFHYVNTLYDMNSSKSMNDILERVRTDNLNEGKNNEKELTLLVRNALRVIIFDHYSSLNKNVRKDLQTRLRNFFAKYKINRSSKEKEDSSQDKTDGDDKYSLHFMEMINLRDGKVIYDDTIQNTERTRRKYLSLMPEKWNRKETTVKIIKHISRAWKKRKLPDYEQKSVHYLANKTASSKRKYKKLKPDLHDTNDQSKHSDTDESDDNSKKNKMTRFVVKNNDEPGSRNKEDEATDQIDNSFKNLSTENQDEAEEPYQFDRDVEKPKKTEEIDNSHKVHESKKRTTQQSLKHGKNILLSKGRGKKKSKISQKNVLKHKKKENKKSDKSDDYENFSKLLYKQKLSSGTPSPEEDEFHDKEEEETEKDNFSNEYKKVDKTVNSYITVQGSIESVEFGKLLKNSKMKKKTTNIIKKIKNQKHPKKFNALNEFSKSYENDKSGETKTKKYETKPSESSEFDNEAKKSKINPHKHHKTDDSNESNVKNKIIVNDITGESDYSNTPKKKNKTLTKNFYESRKPEENDDDGENLNKNKHRELIKIYDVAIHAIPDNNDKNTQTDQEIIDLSGENDDYDKPKISKVRNEYISKIIYSNEQYKLHTNDKKPRARKTTTFYNKLDRKLYSKTRLRNPFTLMSIDQAKNTHTFTNMRVVRIDRPLREILTGHNSAIKAQKLYTASTPYKHRRHPSNRKRRRQSKRRKSLKRRKNRPRSVAPPIDKVKLQTTRLNNEAFNSDYRKKGLGNEAKANDEEVSLSNTESKNKNYFESSNDIEIPGNNLRQGLSRKILKKNNMVKESNQYTSPISINNKYVEKDSILTKSPFGTLVKTMSTPIGYYRRYKENLNVKTSNDTQKKKNHRSRKSHTIKSPEPTPSQKDLEIRKKINHYLGMSSPKLPLTTTERFEMFKTKIATFSYTPFGVKNEHPVNTNLTENLSTRPIIAKRVNGIKSVLEKNTSYENCDMSHETAHLSGGIKIAKPSTVFDHKPPVEDDINTTSNNFNVESDGTLQNVTVDSSSGTKPRHYRNEKEIKTKESNPKTDLKHSDDQDFYLKSHERDYLAMLQKKNNSNFPSNISENDFMTSRDRIIYTTTFAIPETIVTETSTTIPIELTNWIEAFSEANSTESISIEATSTQTTTTQTNTTETTTTEATTTTQNIETTTNVVVTDEITPTIQMENMNLLTVPDDSENLLIRFNNSDNDEQPPETIMNELSQNDKSYDIQTENDVKIFADVLQESASNKINAGFPRISVTAVELDTGVETEKYDTVETNDTVVANLKNDVFDKNFLLYRRNNEPFNESLSSSAYLKP